MTTRARGLSKHRLADDSYAIDFAERLAVGETLTGTPVVTVAERDGTGWDDVSGEFGIDDEAIAGTTVVWTLGAASTGQQDGGEYYVLVLVDTSNGRRLPSTHPLEVRETADPSAP